MGDTEAFGFESPYHFKQKAYPFPPPVKQQHKVSF